MSIDYMSRSVFFFHIISAFEHENRVGTVLSVMRYRTKNQHWSTYTLAVFLEAVEEEEEEREEQKKMAQKKMAEKK